MNTEDRTECPECGREHDITIMRRAPACFAPSTHFLMGCIMFSKANTLNPVSLSKQWFRALFTPGAKQPLCPTCRRIAVLAGIAMYILILGGITAVIIGE